MTDSMSRPAIPTFQHAVLLRSSCHLTEIVTGSPRLQLDLSNQKIHVQRVSGGDEELYLYRMSIRADVRLIDSTSSEKREVAWVEAEYGLVYTGEALNDEAFRNVWGARSVVLHGYPYLREAVHSTLSRMGVVVPPLPLLPLRSGASSTTEESVTNTPDNPADTSTAEG